MTEIICLVNNLSEKLVKADLVKAFSELIYNLTEFLELFGASSESFKLIGLPEYLIKTYAQTR